MKERPILFSGEMVRAILDGRKTQTRRVMAPQPEHLQYHEWRGEVVYEGEHRLWCWKHHTFENLWDEYIREPDRMELSAMSPYGVAGDRLWVRETWAGVRIGKHAPVFYRASCENDACDFADPDDGSIQRVKIAKWRPAIFLPHGAHRITLEITEVRVQRLQEIGDEDAKAEGVERDTSACDHTRASCEEVGCLGKTHRSTFCELWDRINGKRAAWSRDPWVWALTFRRIQ